MDELDHDDDDDDSLCCRLCKCKCTHRSYLNKPLPPCSIIQSSTQK